MKETSIQHKKDCSLATRKRRQHFLVVFQLKNRVIRDEYEATHFLCVCFQCFPNICFGLGHTDLSEFDGKRSCTHTDLQVPNFGAVRVSALAPVRHLSLHHLDPPNEESGCSSFSPNESLESPFSAIQSSSLRELHICSCGEHMTMVNDKTYFLLSYTLLRAEHIVVHKKMEKSW